MNWIPIHEECHDDDVNDDDNDGDCGDEDNKVKYDTALTMMKMTIMIILLLVVTMMMMMKLPFIYITFSHLADAPIQSDSQ